jgi:polyhydroxyalkanoate synthesis repressor PhaR
MSQEAELRSEKPDAPPVVVKKYANRRLYNTESSSYITLENLADMIRAGRDFVVYDAKTGEDITRGVLTQIIVDEESKGRAMLPTNFLRQLIGLYGDSLQGLVPRYLEQAMATFARQQEQMRVAMKQTMGNFFPFGIEEVSRQNMAMMERAMSLFTPLYRAGEAPGAATQGAAAEPEKPAPSEEVTALRAEIAALRAQLEGSKPVAVATRNVEPLPVLADIDTKKVAQGD